jgi:hypothetical protein
MFTTDCQSMKINFILLELKAGSWDTSPEFQRGEVWPLEQKQRMVKSIMDGLPIGTPTLVWPSDKKVKMVIDGKQRLTTIQGFVNGDFKMGSNEETAPQDPTLQGMRFSEFPEVDRQKFLNSSLCIQTCIPLNTAITSAERHKEAVAIIDLFKLLNTQGKKLTCGQLFASCLTEECAPDSARFLLKVFFKPDEQEEFGHIRESWAKLFGKPGEGYNLNCSYNTPEWNKWCGGSGLPILMALVVSFCTGNNHAISSSFKISQKNGLMDPLCEETNKDTFCEKIESFFQMVTLATESGSDRSLKGSKTQIPTIGAISVYMYIANLIHSSDRDEAERGRAIRDALPNFFAKLAASKETVGGILYQTWIGKGQGNRTVVKLRSEVAIIERNTQTTL